MISVKDYLIGRTLYHDDEVSVEGRCALELAFAGDATGLGAYLEQHPFAADAVAAAESAFISWGDDPQIECLELARVFVSRSKVQGVLDQVVGVAAKAAGKTP